ncbi:MAG TPA: 2-oxoacid:acceptor oxidoreductase family protein [Deltaproteobacteria bacterium]|nr:2-oxoacid:acceptor oxidoreductase family protein [Deltaproteobacteria bacterium]
MKRDIIEIRWHGRGGQGAITAAKIVAKATFETGFPGVVMVPTFGTERRGAPVFTSLKLSRDRIYDLSPIEHPDIIVVLDHMLLEEGAILKGLKPGGLIVINTPRPLQAYDFQGMKVAAADVTHLANKAGLPQGVVNSGIIGAFARASNLADMDTLTKAIEEEFAGRRPKENARAALETYEHTVIGGI